MTTWQTYNRLAVQVMNFSFDIAVLLYIAAVLVQTIPNAFLGNWSFRFDWFPVVHASAYVATGLIYAAAGLFLFKDLRWRVCIPLGIIGVFQEATWNFAYYSLYPFFPVYASISHYWIEYTLVIILAAPLLLILQWKLLTVKVRLGIWTAVFPLYLLIYYFMKMPTMSYIPGTLQTSSPVPEALYVMTCVIFYLGTFRLSRPVGPL